MTIAIFGNWYKKTTLDEVSHILDFMHHQGVNVVLSKELRDEMNLRDQYALFGNDTNEVVDFALSVGGDGTFLYTASQIGDKNIPILGINYGHLGFLADVQAKDVDNICEQLVNNNYSIEQRAVLQVTPSVNGAVQIPFALNEVAVMKQELSSMITIEASLNGEYLNTYKADGLVISTPTGSTAYNLSVGGPLMVPQAKSLIISPIATHAMNVRPLVIPHDWEIDLKIRSRSHSYLIAVDGRSLTLSEDVSLHIARAPYTIKVVQIGGHSFIHSLKEKLNWGK